MEKIDRTSFSRNTKQRNARSLRKFWQELDFADLRGAEEEDFIRARARHITERLLRRKGMLPMYEPVKYDFNPS